MYTALSGQVASYKQLEIVANNLANMSTAGYRAERLQFEKVMHEQKAMTTPSMADDIQNPGSLQTDEFVQIKGSFTDLTQGPIEVTNNPLDMAIDGEGFFVVQTEAGERYTRAGNFRLDDQNRLVTQDGKPVQGTGGDIVIEGKDVQVGSDGSIAVDGANVGQLRIVNADPSDLRRDEGLRFAMRDGAVAQDLENTKVQGGALEGSNVNAVRELTDMIMATRLYESFQKARDSGGQMNELRNQHLGSTRG